MRSRSYDRHLWCRQLSPASRLLDDAAHVCAVVAGSQRVRDAAAAVPLRCPPGVWLIRRRGDGHVPGGSDLAVDAGQVPADRSARSASCTDPARGRHGTGLGCCNRDGGSRGHQPRSVVDGRRRPRPAGTTAGSSDARPVACAGPLVHPDCVRARRSHRRSAVALGTRRRWTPACPWARQARPARRPRAHPHRAMPPPTPSSPLLSGGTG